MEFYLHWFFQYFNSGNHALKLKSLISFIFNRKKRYCWIEEFQIYFKLKFYVNNGLSALNHFQESEKVIHLNFKINIFKNCKSLYFNALNDYYRKLIRSFIHKFKLLLFAVKTKHFYELITKLFSSISQIPSFYLS